MQQNNTKLPLLLIAIAFIVLVVGILSYLFFFKPYQDKKRIEAQKENLEEALQESFSEAFGEVEKPLEELTGEERNFKEAEIAYQNCFDKAEKLNENIDGKITNRLRIECGEECSGSRANWEYSFVDWLVNKHPDFCVEFDIEKIKFFLNQKKIEFGDDFHNFKD